MINAFHDRGTIDELGFGRIRDGFADLLAPGISTIQTRVRYFLFVPWIFRRLEEDETPSHAFGRGLRDAEIRLVDPVRIGSIQARISLVPCFETFSARSKGKWAGWFSASWSSSGVTQMDTGSLVRSNWETFS